MSTAKEIAARINKDLKEDDLIITGDIIRSQVIPRTTSGLLSLDVALGGGWPLNQWHEIIGDESSGKTAVALKTIAANQAQDPNYEALWIASEEFVPSYAQAIGCDLERVHVVNTNIMERAYDIVLEFLDARAVDCVVIDSLAQLVPSQEGDDSMEDFTVGLGARMTGKFFRKVRKSGNRSLVVEDRPVLGLVINQWRVKVGGWAPRGQDPKTSPGGKGKNFAFFVRLEVRKDELIDNDMTGKSKQWVGQTMKLYTLKNKSFTPHRTAMADFYFSEWDGFQTGEFDTVKDVYTTALMTGTIIRRGAYYVFGDQQWQGKAALGEALRGDPQLLHDVSTAVMEALGRQKDDGNEE